MGIVATEAEERCKQDLAACRRNCDKYMAESAGLRAELEGLWARAALLEQDLGKADAEVNNLKINVDSLNHELRTQRRLHETAFDLQLIYAESLRRLRPGDLWRYLKAKLGGHNV